MHWGAGGSGPHPEIGPDRSPMVLTQQLPVIHVWAGVAFIQSPIKGDATEIGQHESVVQAGPHFLPKDQPQPTTRWDEMSDS